MLECSFCNNENIHYKASPHTTPIENKTVMAPNVALYANLINNGNKRVMAPNVVLYANLIDN